MKITSYQYIAHNKPKQAILLLEQAGYPVQKLTSEDDLARALKLCEKELGDKFTSKLCELHPDFEILESYFEEKIKKEEVVIPEKTKSVEGETSNNLPAKTNDPHNNRDMIFGIGIAFGFAAFILTAIQIAKK